MSNSIWFITCIMILLNLFKPIHLFLPVRSIQDFWCYIFEIGKFVISYSFHNSYSLFIFISYVLWALLLPFNAVLFWLLLWLSLTLMYVREGKREGRWRGGFWVEEERNADYCFRSFYPRDSSWMNIILYFLL